MKIRKGFISNSSSASFIVAFPKNREIMLSDIENYLGEFNPDIPSEVKGIFEYLIWSSQYFDSSGERRSFIGTEDSYSYPICMATYSYLSKAKNTSSCPGYISEDEKDDLSRLNSTCKSCKFCKIEQRRDRGDDYYEAKDLCTAPQVLTWLETHKDDKIVYVDIDDNELPYHIPYDVGEEITKNAENLLVNTSDTIVCLGGK